MRKLTALVLPLVLAVTFYGCSSANKQTLGGLKYQPKKEKELNFKKMNHQEVRKEYKELLDLFEDKQLKEQIERRIADVYMMEGSHEQNRARPSKSYYLDAIKAYRKILDKYPNSPDNADVLYQLAKAYDMEGKQKEALKMLNRLTQRHPSYPNIAEAYFRKGDIYFNYQSYANAEKSYLAVTQLQNARLRLNAHYMLGWANYKQHRFEKSLQSFSYVMNKLLAGKKDLKQLTKAEKPLARDAIHSTSLVLDKLGGASALVNSTTLSKQSYIWLVYDHLGDYYLKKELYEDSAKTFRAYVMGHRNADNAPVLHKKLIDTYKKGGFPRQALDEKEVYVASYGIRSNYQGQKNTVKASLKPTIKQYIQELAKHNHNGGQLSQKQLAAWDQRAKKKSGKVDRKKYASTRAKMITSFDKAAGFYQEFIDTFPSDKRIDEVYFLKAEVLFSAFRYAKAISDYERVAYRPAGKSATKHRPNAGYAAIISYQKHIDTLPAKNKDVKKWQARAVDSMLRFAKVFHKDKRSASVLTNAAEYLFGLDQYDKALQVSSNLIKTNANLDKTLKKTAYGIMAHSNFKLGDYQSAEDAYYNQRLLVDKKSAEYKQISERLASTIYKKSEQLADAGKKLEAIDQFLKIKKLTPNSPVRITAQYDAAVMLLGLEKWSRAIVELKQLIALYPRHKLSAEFPRKLAFAYEKNENWALAAEHYLALSKKDKDPKLRREALFLAAMMFEKNKNYSTANEHFKRYAYAYKEPFDDRMEARYHLAMNYEKLKDKEKQIYWLRRIVAGDAEAGRKRTERSKWLAAWANIKYGDYFAWEFKRKKLTLPLVKSIGGKQKWLESASTRYQMAADYGIFEFVTMSSFNIADLYQRFANDLRKSPKPRGLSASDRKLYAEIIEEQAGPLDELAMELHQANIDRAWDGQFNEWIDKSFAQMRKLNPERFNKSELIVSYGDEIR